MPPQIEIICGEMNQVEAHVYARVLGADTDGVTIHGAIEGPSCRYAGTLPIRLPLATVDSDMAKVLVPDPCFWTPELPFFYRLQVELRRGGDAIAADNRWLGLRPLGSRGTDLIYAGRRWVLRAVDRDVCPADDAHAQDTVVAWRSASAAMVGSVLEDALLESASRDGLLLVEHIVHRDPEAVVARMRELSRWPAAAIAVIDSRVSLPKDLALPSNILRAAYCAGTTSEVPAWAQACFAAVDWISGQANRHQVPIIAIQYHQGPLTLADARAACDHLQRELAPLGDFAGYIVKTRP